MGNKDPELQVIMDALQTRKYVMAENLAIEAIKKSPWNGQAFFLLGEALMNQGYGQLAKKAFHRASLFNPQAQWIDDIREKLKKLPAGGKKRNVEKWLEVKKSTTVSAAVLTKNESRCIARCLSSLVNAVDEIVVIDTGSTDNTVEIAKSFPKVKVVHFKWCDDFAAARNFGLTQIESNWVLWVDADEYLHPDDVSSVREAASLLDQYDPTPLLHPVLLNKMGQTVSVSYNVPRMFPLRGKLRYHGRIHEQIVPVNGNKYIQLGTHDFFVRIRLLHDGYDPDSIDISKKLERNLRLLEQMTKEDPDDPTWWLYLGREVLAKGETEKGIAILLKTEKKAKVTQGFGALLEIQRLMVQGYLSLSKYQEAEEVCRRMLETDPGFPDTYYYLAYIQMEKARNLYLEAEKNITSAISKFDEYGGLVSPNNEIKDWKGDLLLANLLGKTGRIYASKLKYKELVNKSPAYKNAIEEQIALIDQEAKRIIHG